MLGCVLKNIVRIHDMQADLLICIHGILDALEEKPGIEV